MTDTEKIEKIKEVLENDLGKSTLNCYRSTGSMTRADFDELASNELSIDELYDNLYCFIGCTEKIVKIIYKDNENKFIKGVFKGSQDDDSGWDGE